MNDIILLKLGEIVLKGLNRRSFEQKLTANVRRRLAPIGKFRVYCLQSIISVEGEDGRDAPQRQGLSDDEHRAEPVRRQRPERRL